MYQLIVFPYTDDQELFIRAIGSKNNCRVRKVVTLKGWKQKESCSFFREDGSLTFQPIETDLFPIQESDTLLIPPFFASPRTEQLVVAKIMDLVPVLKHIICAAELNKESVAHIQSKCEGTRNRCTFIEAQACSEWNTVDRPAFDFSEPVVSVLSYFDMGKPLYESLFFQELFTRKGFRTFHLAPFSASRLLDTVDYPTFLRQECDTLDAPIIRLNEFVHSSTHRKGCDLLLVSVPGSVQAYNSCHPSGFGLVPYCVFQAIPADYLVLKVPFAEYTAADYHRISELCKNRFGVGVDFFCIVDAFVNMAETAEQGKIALTTVADDVVQSVVNRSRESGVAVFNAQRENELTTLFESLLDRMQ